MLIKTRNDVLEVKINIGNSKDNAYNTKVILSFSPNINYKKAEVRRPPRRLCPHMTDSGFVFWAVTCVFYFYLYFIFFISRIRNAL